MSIEFESLGGLACALLGDDKVSIEVSVRTESSTLKVFREDRGDPCCYEEAMNVPFPKQCERVVEVFGILEAFVSEVRVDPVGLGRNMLEDLRARPWGGRVVNLRSPDEPKVTRRGMAGLVNCECPCCGSAYEVDIGGAQQVRFVGNCFECRAELDVSIQVKVEIRPVGSGPGGEA